VLPDLQSPLILYQTDKSGRIVRKRFQSTDPDRRYYPMNKPGGRVQPGLDSYQDKGQGMSMDWQALPFFMRHLPADYYSFWESLTGACRYCP